MSHKRILAAGLVIAVAGCSTPKLEIREVGAIHEDRSDGTTSGRVALGMSQLALGNVGLAIESFRRASREDPQSYLALQGLAECYLQIGRPAVARRSLEQALALRPDVPDLYRALAAAAKAEGKIEEADKLLREAALRAAGPGVPAIQKPAPELAAQASEAVTIEIAPALPRDPGPRLVRLSLGEIALVTKPGSPFPHNAELADSTLHPPLRILNAARIQGIAARTRELLAAGGLTGADIGDAEQRQQVSEIRFAKAERRQARSLAAKLPFAVEMVERDGPLVLLVGRNAAP